MDEKRSGYSLKAPGASGGSMYLPSRGSFPRVDDHLVVPGVDPLDPSSTPFITFDCSNLSGHPYRRVQVP
jgi:hypothetical protein